MHFLVTAGATREPLDAVRFLSNVSTGSTGAALADALAVRGHTVTLLRGEGATQPHLVQDVDTFSSTADLEMLLRERLAIGAVNAVVMTAAVSDYRPEQVRDDKITSDAESLTVRLVRNPKLLPQLKSFSPRPLAVIGFKLTVGADDHARRAAVAAQFATGTVDATVQNHLVEIRHAPGHPFWLYRSADGTPQPISGTVALAAAIDAAAADILDQFAPQA